MKRMILAVFCLLLMIVACSPVLPAPTAAAVPTQTAMPTSTATTTPTATATATMTATTTLAPATPMAAKYEFVAAVRNEKVRKYEVGWTKTIEIVYLREGDWMIIEGSGAFLASSQIVLGDGEVCFVVGIEGPTDVLYQFETSGEDYMSLQEGHSRWTSFHEEMKSWISVLSRLDDCEGVEVWTIPPAK